MQHSMQRSPMTNKKSNHSTTNRIYDHIYASTVVAQDHGRPCLPRCRSESLEHATTCDHVIAVTADFEACIEDRNCFADRTTTHTSGYSSTDTSL